jgi:hypothetical protein
MRLIPGIVPSASPPACSAGTIFQRSLPVRIESVSAIPGCVLMPDRHAELDEWDCSLGTEQDLNSLSRVRDFCSELRWTWCTCNRTQLAQRIDPPNGVVYCVHSLARVLCLCSVIGFSVRSTRQSGKFVTLVSLEAYHAVAWYESRFGFQTESLRKALSRPFPFACLLALY